MREELVYTGVALGVLLFGLAVVSDIRQRKGKPKASVTMSLAWVYLLLALMMLAATAATYSVTKDKLTMAGLASFLATLACMVYFCGKSLRTWRLAFAMMRQRPPRQVRIVK